MKKTPAQVRPFLTMPPEVAASLGSRGGIARWRGVSKKKRSAYGRKIARMRWRRVALDNPLDS